KKQTLWPLPVCRQVLAHPPIVTHWSSQRDGRRAEYKLKRTLFAWWDRVESEQSAVVFQAHREIIYRNRDAENSLDCVPVTPGRSFGHAQRARRDVCTQKRQIEQVGERQLPRNPLPVGPRAAAGNRAFEL